MGKIQTATETGLSAEEVVWLGDRLDGLIAQVDATKGLVRELSVAIEAAFARKVLA